jgi:hypothetical protein
VASFETKSFLIPDAIVGLFGFSRRFGGVGDDFVNIS